MGRAWSQGKSQFSFFVAVVVVAVVVVVMTQSISLRRKATLDYEGKLDVE